MKKYIFLLIALFTVMTSWGQEFVKQDGVTYLVTKTVSTTNVSEALTEVVKEVVIFTDSANVTSLSGTVEFPASFEKESVSNDVTTKTTYNVVGFKYWRYGNKVSLDMSKLTSMTNIQISTNNSIYDPSNYYYTYYYNYYQYNIGIYSDIETLKLPKELTSISFEETTCYGPSHITAFEVDDDNNTYSTQDGVLFSNGGKTLVCYPHLKEGVVYTVPDDVTAIGNSAFYNNKKLQKVVLPTNISKIGNYSFDYCGNLIDVNFPTSLTQIGTYAFASCKLNFTDATFTLPSSLTSIGAYAFSGGFVNSGNVTVVFPSNMGTSGKGLNVGDRAFNCGIIRAEMTDPAVSHTDAFYDVSSIYVPKGCKDKYTIVEGWGYNNTTIADKIKESSSSTDNPDYEKVAKPTIAETISGSSLNLTFSTTTEDATIRYKIYSGSDNSDPVDWDKYDNQTKSISDKQSVKVIALKDGMNNSDITQKTYDFSAMRCKKPNINFNQTDTLISITTATDDATIYYTLDGSTPSKTNGIQYKEAFKATGNNQTYQAIAVEDGMFDSDVSSPVSTNDFFKCPNVVIEQVVVGGAPKMKLSLSDEDIAKVNTEGMQIYYGVDNYWWNDNDWQNYGTAYTEPVYVNSNRYIYAVAIKDGYSTSDRRSLMMDYSGFTRCATPSIELDNENKKVTITTTETNGKIYYTLDNSDPTTESTLYTEPFTSDKKCTVKAITARDAETVDGVTTIYANSVIATQGLEDWFRLDYVKFIPVLGTAEGEYKMALDAEEGATIEYGINTYGGTTYTREPRDTFAVSEGNYIYAIARKDGYEDSYWAEYFVNSENYTVSAPSINVDRDTYEIFVTSSTDGATIYYTNDGSDPTVESNKLVDGKVTATRNDQYRFIAVKDGMTNSSVSSYTVNWFRVPRVVITPYGENNQLKVKLTCEDTNATIYYGVGYGNFNTDDITANAKYDPSSPLTIKNGEYIYASAIRDGYNNAYTSELGYIYESTYRTNSPAITVAADRVVTISAEENAIIYYTLDGTNPTIESTKYTDKFTLTENTTIKAIAIVDQKLISEIRTNNYTGFYCADVVAEQIFDNGMPKMKLTTETSDATIYYGIGYYGDNEYTEPVEAYDGSTIYFRASKKKFNDSNWGSASISYSGYVQCSQPSIEINNEAKTIKLTTSEENGKIYYTLDGTTPTTASTLYSEPFTSEVNCTVKAITARDPETVDEVTTVYANSYVSQTSLDDWFRLANVKFHPVLGEAEGTYRMALEAEEGVTIEYGINEYGHTIYTDTFDVDFGAYVYAIARKEGGVDSYWNSYRISTDSYTVRQPVINANDVTHVMTVTTETDGADIYYTTDGTDPTTSSQKLTSSEITLTRNDSYKFMAAKDGMYNSSINSYEINWFRVSDVTIEPFVENNLLKVRLSCEDKSATIYYAINDFNSDNVTANAEYKAPFEIQNGNRVYASAVRTGYNNSDRAYSDYIYTSTYTCKNPTITIATDTTLTISPGVDGETIYYTLDGTDPTTSSTKFTGKFKLTGNVTIKAIAAASGKLTSSVVSRDYNNFNVKDIKFTLDGTKMTITSSTPGVTIKYQYEAEGTATMDYPHTYTGPFELQYNGNLYVLAEKDGYNSSTSSNRVNDLVKCKVEKVSYDGHSLTLKSSEGATIWYSTNGNRPYDNSNNWYDWVYKYDGPIAIDNTGAIMAIATSPYRNESDVFEEKINSYAGETGATTDEAGGLEASMAWKKDPENIKEFKIVGPVNSDDLNFINTKMTSLQTLDLSGATADGGNIPDNAFAGMPLVMFSSPNALQSVGKNIFTGCKDLAAVVWNTTTKIPNDAFDKDVNPNLLVFVPAEDAAPTSSSARNIIVNNTAENIYLSDGEDNNFYSPKQFYTKNITYTHDFKLTTGSASGWETICLPFDCSYFVHESKGELKPFAEYDGLSDKGSYKPFWLRELTDIGFQDVKMIQANKPYIISMPNNEGYATRYRVGGKVTFSASNVYVPQTVQGSAQKGDVTLYANFMNSSETSDMLLLNTEASDDHEAGSIFVLNSGRAVRPFEAYVISRARSRAYISVRGLGGDDDDDATAITERTIEDSDMVKVYNLSGVLVKQSTKEDALKGLAKGVYIVNGKRMIVK